MMELLPFIQPLLGSTADLAMIAFLWGLWRLDRRLIRLEAILKLNGKKK